MIKKGKGYARFAARTKNIINFHIYETYKLRDNHYFIRSLKTLNIRSILIPSVGWVNVGL